MTIDGQHLLRIYFDAALTFQGQAYDDVLLTRARQMKIASAAVLRVMQAYGDTAIVHGAHARDLAPDQHLIVELVDVQSKLKAFVEALELSVEIGLVTLEKVQVVGYGGHRHHGG